MTKVKDEFIKYKYLLISDFNFHLLTYLVFGFHLISLSFSR